LHLSDGLHGRGSEEVDVSEKAAEGGGRLGFLDSLGRLFRAQRDERAPDATPKGAPTASGFAKLEADFQAAIRELNERVEAHQQGVRQTARSAGPARESTEDRAADRQRRIDASHRAIREDIEKMHARLATGITGADIDAISAFVAELEPAAAEDRNSHDLLPRARYAIAEKLRAEAGELAIARIVALLSREKLDWPDPTHHRATMSAEEIERSRRRRLADVREGFLVQGFRTIAERMNGIVRGWGGDYPDRDSPLWEESVLEGVAAGIRGSLLRDFVEVLHRDRDELLLRAEAAVGKELGALQSVLAGGVHSIEQANQAVASSLRVLDEVVPEIAWEAVVRELPQARGDTAS
jgi:hypothetical protein